MPAGTLREIMLVFLRLGLISFGGPAAHTALMEDEVVRRRHWLTRADFLDYVGATNLIPGPNSTELAIHLGHRRGGWPGLLLAGSCFILPAALLVGVLAWAYSRYGTAPQLNHILYGIRPVVIAVIAQALWGLGRSAIKTPWLALIAAASLAASIGGLNELLVLLGAAIAGSVPAINRQGTDLSHHSVGWLVGTAAAGVALANAASLPAILFEFVKVGSVLFGSGYVLLAFLQADLVDGFHWITQQQLLDAIAIGQAPPGPVFTTATFVGYLLHGPAGAVVATIGIFLPAFVFVALSGPLIPRIRGSRVLGAALDGVNVGSLALMAAVTWTLGRASLVDPLTVLIALASSLLLLRFRVNSAWLVGAGAVAGLIRG